MIKYFTSESVTEGHPDKICDQISDAILDVCLKQDPNSRVACETFVTTGQVNVIGEITTEAYIDIPDIARQVIQNIGYTKSEYGFSYDSCGITTSIHQQSPDIALRTDDENGGAGDQGIMFGYACDETPEYMPLAISLAHKLTQRLTLVRKLKLLPYLRPDGKSQVTIKYEDNIPVAIDTIVISAQHDEGISQEQLREDIIKYVILPCLPEKFKNNNIKYLINPSGRFVLGGPAGDTGLTGRKIVVDTYGGYAHHGGGCFSGKDPTKVDRSASYMLRYIAKNIVAAGIANKCEIQVAYAIGQTEPVSLYVDTFGTGKISDDKIIELIKNNFDLRPQAIIKKLKLRKPIYTSTTNYGHFGREYEDFTWEKLDMKNKLKNTVENLK